MLLALRPSRAALLTATLVAAAMAFAAPAASAATFNCEASALRGTLLGTATIEPAVANRGAGRLRDGLGRPQRAAAGAAVRRRGDREDDLQRPDGRAGRGRRRRPRRRARAGAAGAADHAADGADLRHPRQRHGPAHRPLVDAARRARQRLDRPSPGVAGAAARRSPADRRARPRAGRDGVRGRDVQRRECPSSAAARRSPACRCSASSCRPASSSTRSCRSSTAATSIRRTSTSRRSCCRSA